MAKKTPSSVLLPSYLSHQVWTDLCDAMDEVFGDNVDPIHKALSHLRDIYPGDLEYVEDGNNSSVAVAVQNRELFDTGLFDSFDMETEKRRLNMMGLPLTDSSGLTDSMVTRLHQNIGEYWFNKGGKDVVDFLSFVLNIEANMVNLWTKDYINFFEHGSPSIGTPVWQGGEWYPTTHVRLFFDSGASTSISLQALVNLFYDVANYNLVLDGISFESYNLIVTQDSMPPPGHPSTVGWPAPILSIAHYEVITDYITSSAP